MNEGQKVQENNYDRMRVVWSISMSPSLSRMISIRLHCTSQPALQKDTGGFRTCSLFIRHYEKVFKIET